MKKTNKPVLLCVIFLGTAFLSCPQRVALSITGTMEKCMTSLIPGLFPFMILGNMLVECGGTELLKKLFSKITGRLFGLSGACSLPMAVGLISGLPVGATMTAELVKKGEITKEEGERVLCFCNNPGPAFVISAVAGMLGCGKAEGVILWASVVLSALVAGIFFGMGKKRIKISNNKTDTVYGGVGECVVNSVKKSVTGILNICGFVVFFGVVTDIILMWKPGHIAQIVTGGFFEVTNGCVKLSVWNPGKSIKLPFASAFLGWSGLCAHAQVAAAVSGCGISMKRYMRAKLLQTVASPVITHLLLKTIPFSVPATKVTETDPVYITAAWAFIALVVGFGIILTLFSVFSESKKPAKM